MWTGLRRLGYFRNLSLSHSSARAISEVLRFEEMTAVQKAAIPQVFECIAQEHDLLVQAQTGSGKTLAFLLPIIESLASSESPKSQHVDGNLGVRALIISPTRELTIQIARECEKLLSFHSINVLPLIGGVSRQSEEIQIQRRKPDLLICTLGRLIHHFEATLGFNHMFNHLNFLVLDEADVLLQTPQQSESLRDMLTFLPTKRTNLMFSATLNKDVENICRRIFKPNYRSISCGGQDEPTIPRLLRQEYVRVPPVHMLNALYMAITEQMQANPYRFKIIVFFPTARLTVFMCKFFMEQLGIGVHEMHSRRATEIRTVTSKQFREARSGILFTSDVSARGLDYPDVTLVVQCFAPTCWDQYVHRVGRTGRQGKPGHALLLLASPAEEHFLKKVKDLAVTPSNNETAYLALHPMVSNAISSWVSKSTLHFLAETAYTSLLSHYKMSCAFMKMTDSEICRNVQLFLTGMGLAETPMVPASVASILRMDCPELKVKKEENWGADEKIEKLSNEHMFYEKSR